MKQHITKEQWNELNDKQQSIFYEYGLYDLSPSILNSSDEIYYESQLPNIGQMIEYIYDDVVSIKCSKELLCDILWEEVKYKLKQ